MCALNPSGRFAAGSSCIGGRRESNGITGAAPELEGTFLTRAVSFEDDDDNLPFRMESAGGEDSSATDSCRQPNVGRSGRPLLSELLRRVREKHLDLNAVLKLLKRNQRRRHRKGGSFAFATILTARNLCFDGEFGQIPVRRRRGDSNRRRPDSLEMWNGAGRVVGWGSGNGFAAMQRLGLCCERRRKRV
jgi:hypothetical protein